MSPFELKIWRLHPSSSKITPAEKTLNNTAHPGGIKWCQPYTTANRLGWWLSSPVDIDIIWKGKSDFQYNLLSPYSPTDATLVRNLIKDSDVADVDKWCPLSTGRTKFTWGTVDDGLVQIWTGLILQTPPGWCLQMRSPINCERQAFRIQEGILETDWMQYDLWINVQFDQINTEIKIRKDQFPPLAQLIPIRREAFKENWQVIEQDMNRDTPESNQAFEFWINYNQRKFCQGGNQLASTIDPSQKKNSTTFYQVRKEHVGNGMESKSIPSKIFSGLKKISPFVKKKRIAPESSGAIQRNE